MAAGIGNLGQARGKDAAPRTAGGRDRVQPTDVPSSEVSGEEISRLAYALWERAGRPDGRSEEYWFEAERQLRSR